MVSKIGGNFKYSPFEMKSKMSLDTKKFLKDSFIGVDTDNLIDVHAHVTGVGSGGTGLWVNPHMRDGFNVYKRLQFKVYLSAAGITDVEKADEQYVARHLELLQSMPFKMKTYLLAFDYHYDLTGNKKEELSSFYVPNHYVYKLSKLYPEYFVPVISIHPYRQDALQELKKWGDKGVKMLKWLPNSMGMNPSHYKIIPFYKLMKKYNMVLLTHTGDEKAVEGDDFQQMGNPLHLKVALDLGVRVIMAHMASLGECADFENNNMPISCFDLSMRLMDRKVYNDLLFADISGLTIHTRTQYLSKILVRKDLHSRLIYGSDYPLPAVNFIYRTGELEEMGYITKKEQEMINEIYHFNPILFDFVLKRTLSDPKTKAKFSPSVFSHKFTH